MFLKKGIGKLKVDVRNITSSFYDIRWSLYLIWPVGQKLHIYINSPFQIIFHKDYEWKHLCFQSIRILLVTPFLLDPALFVRCFVKVANLSVDLIASDVSEAPLCNSQTKVQVDGYGFSFLQDTSIQIDVISNIIYSYAATKTIDIYIS